MKTCKALDGIHGSLEEQLVVWVIQQVISCEGSDACRLEAVDVVQTCGVDDELYECNDIGSYYEKRDST